MATKLSVHSVMSFVDPDEPVQLIGDVLRGVGRRAPSVDRVRGLVSLFGDRSAPRRHAQAECDVGEALARHLGISETIVGALGDLCERWDGKGFPSGKKGDESALLARIVIVAEVLEIAFSRYGIGAAVETARKRSGGRFDPALASTFGQHAPELFAGLTTGSVWELFLESEPEPYCQVTPALVERYAEAFARAVDLKSVWTATHSYDVGILAAASAQGRGAGPVDRTPAAHGRLAP